MKEKRLTYFLFPVVAAIWGYAIYKYVFETQQDVLPITAISTNLEPSQPRPIEPMDTFSLIAQYRDPFLGKSAESPPKQSAPQPSVNVTSEVTLSKSARPNVALDNLPDWPSYKYNGLIQRSGTENKVGLLQFKNRSYFVNIGNQIGEATVLFMNVDSIGLQVRDERKTLIRR